MRLQGAGRLIGYSELDLQLAVFFAPLPEFLRQAERVGAIVLNRSCLVLPRNGNIVEFLRNMGRWRHRRGRGTRRERGFVRESVPNYNRAARMVEQMEAAGVVGPVQSNGSREVLALPPPD